MWNKGFEGWYFKHQRGEDTVAFIPGRAESGAFVQVLTAEGSRQYSVPKLTTSGSVIRAGNCVFTPEGCQIDLPGISGEICYGTLTPLKTDIMGPFRFLPLQCRHGVISMAHALTGSVTVEGKTHNFNGGMGYIEKDRGSSFPSSYQWLQCNDFPRPCSVMASVANIPFCGMHFTGCICAVVLEGCEYRFATYNGVRILAADEHNLCLRQGKLLLKLEISPVCSGHALCAPINGKMTGTIRESVDAEVRLRLWAYGRKIVDLSSLHAACEYVPFSSK